MSTRRAERAVQHSGTAHCHHQSEGNSNVWPALAASAPSAWLERMWQSVDDTLKAQGLLMTLTQVELIALESIAVGESLRDLALRLETDILTAQNIRKSMKMKLGAQLDADAVRIAIYAGIAD